MGRDVVGHTGTGRENDVRNLDRGIEGHAIPHEPVPDHGLDVVLSHTADAPMGRALEYK